MPEEIFIIVITSIVVGAGITMVKTVTNYMLSRQKKGDLTSGELSRLISDAVEESVRPLQEQVSRLESSLGASSKEPPRLGSARSARPLDPDDMSMETHES
jgi:hypothetical protein